MELGFHFINGKQFIKLSQSFIKEFVYKGEIIEYCPYQIKRKRIDNAYDLTTMPMMNGNYFEAKAIGMNVDGGAVLDLPRLRTGKRSADHKRIDAQVRNFHNDVKKYRIDINRHTVQQYFTKVITDLVPDLYIIIGGTLDIMSYIYYSKIYHKAVIDLKLTKDVNTTGGNFGWGDPNVMDHLQAYIYHYLTGGLPFYYMVYDYKPASYEKKLLPVHITPLHLREMRESIRKACAEIVMCEMDGWKPRPGIILNAGWGRQESRCKKCPVADCPYFNNENFIINKT